MARREDRSQIEGSQRQLVDDVMTRFVFSLSEEDKRSHGHYAHLQNAFWFYKDFYAKGATREPGESELNNLRDFCCYVWEHYPFLREAMHHQGLLTFEDYYHDARAFFHSLSACGAILLNPTRQKVVLVTNNHYDLSFPKGKALQGEKSYDCAVREVTEETGIVIDVMSDDQIERLHKYRPPPFSKMKAREAVSEPRRIALDPSVFISIEFKPQTFFKLFLVKDVHESLTFTPQVRNEISKVEWHDLEQLTD